jgi:hypothetical protein
MLQTISTVFRTGTGSRQSNQPLQGDGAEADPRILPGRGRIWDQLVEQLV